MIIETLAPEEARVLGALLEKSLATPDYYPMTLNALRTACNQKSSREPVSEYGEAEINAALAGLKRKTLVTFVPYGSQPNNYKYRHFLEDPRFNLRKSELALLAVLLLRGAQTLNEIKTRAASLHPVGEEAEGLLAGLAARPEPLVELLPKRPGWKEPRWRDRLREHAAETETDYRAPAYEDATESRAQAAAQPSQREEIDQLKREVAELQAEQASLKEFVDRVKRELFGADA